MSYTRAQVGAANTPDAHNNTGAPAGMAVFDQDGDEFSLPAHYVAGSGRSFRAGHQAPQAAPIALSDPMGRRAAEHLDRGAPDRRRQDKELSGHPSGESARFAPVPVEYVNERVPVTIAPETAPERPRQGFTGADPTRAAQLQHAHVMRPFDQGIAQHPVDVVKAEQASPRAHVMPNRGDLAGGFPSASGQTGTQRAGIGPQPNTFRLMPKPWDALVINTGGPAASTANPDPAAGAATRQARRFR